MRLNRPVSRLICASLCGALWIEGARAGTTNAPPPPTLPPLPATLELHDVNGRPVRPLAATNVTATAFIFVSNDCPICNRYAPEIRELSEQYRSRGVGFWLVHPREDETPEAIRDHAREYALPEAIPLLRDPDRALTRLTGVRVTPEAVVVTRTGDIAYRGRIDDRFPALGQKRARPTRRDLRDALDALLAGRPVPQPVTRAIGCAIPEVP